MLIIEDWKLISVHNLKAIKLHNCNYSQSYASRPFISISTRDRMDVLTISHCCLSLIYLFNIYMKSENRKSKHLCCPFNGQANVATCNCCPHSYNRKTLLLIQISAEL